MQVWILIAILVQWLPPLYTGTLSAAVVGLRAEGSFTEPYSGLCISFLRASRDVYSKDSRFLAFENHTSRSTRSTNLGFHCCRAMVEGSEMQVSGSGF